MDNAKYTTQRQIRTAQLATLLGCGPPSSPPITYKEKTKYKRKINNTTYNSSAYQDNETADRDDEENEDGERDCSSWYCVLLSFVSCGPVSGSDSPWKAKSQEYID